ARWISKKSAVVDSRGASWCHFSSVEAPLRAACWTSGGPPTGGRAKDNTRQSFLCPLFGASCPTSNPPERMLRLLETGRKSLAASHSMRWSPSQLKETPILDTPHDAWGSPPLGEECCERLGAPVPEFASG